MSGCTVILHSLANCTESHCLTTLTDPGAIPEPCQIQGFAPLGFSRQYESQHDIPEKVFCVESC